jgi:flagellar biosynthesis GTPase FlhF
LGAKKRAKLEAKEEKRQQREVEDRLREERKAKEAKEEEERKKQAEQEEEEERKQREEAIRLKQEQLQREQEEYLAMKSAFTVEEEGCDVHDTEEEVNLLEKFVQYVKEKKVILFEELATHFGLKVPAAIDRLNTLVAEGRLTGVMDDRGKFIYISEEELLKFAKFIKQRGRVSISDLVDNSSNIINLSQDLRSASAEA